MSIPEDDNVYSRKVAPACTCPRASDSVSHITPSTLHPHHTPTTYSPEIGSKMSQACISECGHAHQHVVTHTRVPTCTHCTQTQQNTHMHENTCMHVHAHMHARTHTDIQAHTHRIIMHTCAQIHVQVHKHTYAHLCTRTRAHTHARAPVRNSQHHAHIPKCTRHFVGLPVGVLER